MVVSYDNDHFHRFLFGCKFGFNLTCVSIAVNLIQLCLRCSECDVLFNCLTSIMCLLFLAFFIMACIYAYPKGAVQCMQFSLGGRVLWYYATITLVLIALSCVSICAVACCVGIFASGQKVGEQEGGSNLSPIDGTDSEEDIRLHDAREQESNINKVLQV